ncbi:MAG: hypothetical protein JO308_19310, partial [Verrucomicrobia bacterium]|nr:hypothetical protein [Verrucomicrobiota bacterium]
QNWRAVLRPDTVAFLALYGLTFLEFLLPQPEVNDMTNAGAMRHAVLLALLAFGAMALGRHLSPKLPTGLSGLVQRPTPPSALLTIFWISFFFGTFYMLLAVNFNPMEMIDRMMGPRFTQPWGRGRYGDFRALLNEVGAVINLVPPLAGLILSDRQRYRPLTWMTVALVYGFCLFMGLAGSTRNVLGAYIITFLIAYSLNLTRKRVPEFAVLCLIGVAGFFVSSKIMLETRTIGLKEYLRSFETQGPKAPELKFEEQAPETIYFDLNLVNVAELSDVFPKTHAFLGFEVPYVAFTHPIPRAIWPGKPIGLSISMESALGVGPEMTVSSTFIGESYMAGGAFAVALTALFFGILTGWWGRMAIGLSSALGLLIYASGFLAVVISMRSLFTLTVTILPTTAAILMAMVFTKKSPPTKSPDRTDIPARGIPSRTHALR